MGTPRTWFPEKYPRIVDFIPLQSIQSALAKLRKEKQNLFYFEGIVSITQAKAEKIIDKKDKKTNIEVKVIRKGPRAHTRIRYPITGKLDIDTPLKPAKEIITDVEGITGLPELTPDIVLKRRGISIKLPRALEDEIQGVDSLYRFEKSRFYQPKSIEKIIGIRFFKPFKSMRPTIANRVNMTFDMRRSKSILETKWIVGDSVGFETLRPKLQHLQNVLTANKFNQDVALYHKISNQHLAGINFDGRVYNLLKRDEFVPLWPEPSS